MKAFLMRGWLTPVLADQSFDELRIALDRRGPGVKTASFNVGDERLWPAKLRVARRQLLPDVEQAQVACVAVVAHDGVVVAPRGLLDHRAVGEEHQVIPRQLNALAPGVIVVDQSRSEGLLALVHGLDVAHARPFPEAHALLFQIRLHGTDDRVVLVVLGVDEHGQLDHRLAEVHGEAVEVPPALDHGMLGSQGKNVGPVVPEIRLEEPGPEPLGARSVPPKPPPG